MAPRDGLTVTRYSTVDAFEERAFPFLIDREAEHNLFLGICHQIKEGRYKDFYLATAERDGSVVGAAFRTPPFNVGLSVTADEAAVDAICDDVAELYGDLPGVIADKATARVFAERWRAATGQQFEVAIEQRIYQVTTVRPPHGVDGAMRVATKDDRDVVVAWLRAFNEEALRSGAAIDIETTADWRIGKGSLVLWWTDVPVSMAGASSPTPNGIGVNAVYTPPEHRRRGYASACVAALTQKLLDEGRTFCFLFTDLANPTSNSIYQRIGYTPVCDVDQYRFSVRR